MICSGVWRIRFMVKSPAQSVRMRTLIHRGPNSGDHATNRQLSGYVVAAYRSEHTSSSSIATCALSSCFAVASLELWVPIRLIHGFAIES
jgi:hypothetical protein